jgi:hypothetical protein
MARLIFCFFAEEVAALLGGHWSKSPVIEDEKLDASQAREEPSVHRRHSAVFAPFQRSCDHSASSSTITTNKISGK